MSTALLHRCRDAKQRGVAFPGIWHTILKTSQLVSGLPIQIAPGRIAVPLMGGLHIVFYTDTGQFELE